MVFWFVLSAACLLPLLCFVVFMAFKPFSWEPYYYITYFIDVGPCVASWLTNSNMQILNVLAIQTVTDINKVSFITMSWQFRWGKQILMVLACSYWLGLGNNFPESICCFWNTKSDSSWRFMVQLKLDTCIKMTGQILAHLN